jgi:putative ATP-dependent DNA ligase
MSPHAELPGFLGKFLKEDDARRRKLSPYQWDGSTFVRARQDARGLARGTVLWEGGVIHGYPRIPRTLHLERALRRYFKDGFHVEEKVDGYNVRACRVGDRTLAFTRGGFVCPFTTDRLPDLVNPDFFDRHPGLVLCGEVAGPQNPYNTEAIAYIDRDVRFFAFDIMDERGNHLPAHRRHAVLKETGIPQVRRWGPFGAEDIDEIRAIVLELDAGGREGIVIKPADAYGPSARKGTLKFVTLSSCLRDLEATGRLLAELPSGFFAQRILRAVYFSHEFGVPLDDRYLLQAARALYRPNLDLVEGLEGGGDLRESFQVLVRRRETVDSLIGHLGRDGVRTSLVSVEPEGGYQRARFHKIYAKGTRQLRRRLRGHGFFD